MAEGDGRGSTGAVRVNLTVGLMMKCNHIIKGLFYGPVCRVWNRWRRLALLQYIVSALPSPYHDPPEDDLGEVTQSLKRPWEVFLTKMQSKLQVRPRSKHVLLASLPQCPPLAEQICVVS